MDVDDVNRAARLAAGLRIARRERLRAEREGAHRHPGEPLLIECRLWADDRDDPGKPRDASPFEPALAPVLEVHRAVAPARVREEIVRFKVGADARIAPEPREVREEAWL